MTAITQKRVLVVDDEALTRTMVADLVRGCGHDVAVADSGFTSEDTGIFVDVLLNDNIALIMANEQLADANRELEAVNARVRNLAEEAAAANIARTCFQRDRTLARTAATPVRPSSGHISASAYIGGRYVAIPRNRMAMASRKPAHTTTRNSGVSEGRRSRRAFSASRTNLARNSVAARTSLRCAAPYPASSMWPTR